MGVVISAGLVIAGIVLLFVQGGVPGYSLAQVTSAYSPLNTKTYSFSEAFSHFSGITLIYSGLIVLIFTPISRVILLVAKFASVKDRLYLILSLIVLINLTIAIILIPHL